MRSLTMKAALAALLISTPLATAYAAPLPGGSMGTYNDQRHMTVPSKATAPSMHLDAILTRLHVADGRIATYQGRQLLSPREARNLRSEVGMIRKEAYNAAAADHKVLPAGRYHSILAQINRLDRAIDRDARRA